MMRCEECQAELHSGLYVRRKWAQGWFPVRCQGCGAVHTTRHGECELIGPAMLPVAPELRLGPWRPHSTRPVRVGWYDCRFTDTEPRRLRLWWDGRNFTHDGQPVLMRTFMGWRGSYADV